MNTSRILRVKRKIRRRLAYNTKRSGFVLDLFCYNRQTLTPSMMKRVYYLLICMLIFTASCHENSLPALHTTITNTYFEDFVYTNNGYLLIFENNTKNASKFKMYLKSDNKNSLLQPIFPLSLRDTLFASNLIYVHVGKEGESWLLFDKTSIKKDAVKRYKLIKYDVLRRITEKTFFILPIAGRDFSNIRNLQIDEKNQALYYIDDTKGDYVFIDLSTGNLKSFSFPSDDENPMLAVVTALRSKKRSSKYSLALNTYNSTLYLINQSDGLMYSVNEKYLLNKEFYNKDVQSQTMLAESGLKGVVDVEFDSKSRPIVATETSIFLIRNRDKVSLIKNFSYGKITAISYANNRVYFSAKSKKSAIYSVEISK